MLRARWSLEAARTRETCAGRDGSHQAPTPPIPDLPPRPPETAEPAPLLPLSGELRPRPGPCQLRRPTAGPAPAVHSPPDPEPGQSRGPTPPSDIPATQSTPGGLQPPGLRLAPKPAATPTE